MKNNLATFPKCCLDEKHYCERDIWKSDFEDELRKKMEYNKRLSNRNARGKYNLLKEILDI